MVARSGRKTDISLWDHVRLKHELLSRPAYVLRYFKACGIAALVEIELFHEIARENPDAARRIAAAAAKQGIPLLHPCKRIEFEHGIEVSSR